MNDERFAGRKGLLTQQLVRTSMSMCGFSGSMKVVIIVRITEFMDSAAAQAMLGKG